MQKTIVVGVLVVCGCIGAQVNFTYAAGEVEQEVRSFFEDAPVMIEIARCESKFKQFGNDGLALRGGYGGGMVGVFQIYESIHTRTAKNLGFDLSTLEGNLAYAKHLYEASGPTPWNSSKSCWEQARSTQSIDTQVLEKKIVQLQKLVAQLQKLLEQKKAA